MTPKLVAILVAIGSTTCCPSLFLSVEKTRPAPRTPMPDAQIVEHPILAPSYMDNRFLDEELTADTEEYREYTDNPQDLQSLARALASLERLEDKFGVPRAKRIDVDIDPKRPGRAADGRQSGSPRVEIRGNLSCPHYNCRAIRISCRDLPELKDSNASWLRAPWMKRGRVVKIESAGNREGRYWRVVSEWPDDTKIDQVEKACVQQIDRTIQEKHKQKTDIESYVGSVEGNLTDKQVEKAAIAQDIANLELARRQIENKLKDLELDQRELERDGSRAAGARKQIKDKLSRTAADMMVQRRSEQRLARDKLKSEIEIKAVEVDKLELERKTIANGLVQKKSDQLKLEQEIIALKGDRDKLETSWQDLAPSDQAVSSEAAGLFIDLSLQGQISGDDGAEVVVSPLDRRPSLSKTLLTFVHVSDIQIRDRDVRLGDEDLSRRLDWLIEQSFEYDPELEFNNRYLVESLFATVNEEVEDTRRCVEDSAGERVLSPRAAPILSRSDEESLDTVGQPAGITSKHPPGSPLSSGSHPPWLSLSIPPLSASVPATSDDGHDARGCDGKTKGDVPSFVIHTGDAIDSGVMTELDDFHRLVDRLNVPFYNVIGNHDILVFGNLMPTRDPHSDAECAEVATIAAAKADWLRQRRYLLPNKLCVNARVRCPSCDRAHVPELVVVGRNHDPITHANARAHFIEAFNHRRDAGIPLPIDSKTIDEIGATGSDGGKPQEPAQAASPQRPVLAIGDELERETEANKQRECSALIQFHPGRSTWRHGFEVDPNSSEHRGYYAFKWPLEMVDGEHSPRILLSVVLDTEDLRENEAGTAGRIQKPQMTWLNSVLDCAGPRDLVIVFGHDAISAVQTEERTGNPATEQPAGELDRVLKAHKNNVIAYLFGHDHNHQICRDKRDGKNKNVCNGFWEVQTASLLEFSQEARQIKIKSAGEGMAFLEVVSFQERLANTTDERARAVALARAAAQRDWCRSQPNARCSEGNRRVHRADGDDTYARLWFKLPGLDARDR